MYSYNNLLKFIDHKVNIKELGFKLDQIMMSYIKNKNSQGFDQEKNHELIVIVNNLQYYERQLYHYSQYLW